MSPIPKAAVEMHWTGGKGEPPLIIRHPTTLEPTRPAMGPRPTRIFGAMTDAARGHLVAMIGEYLGTTMFLFFGFIAAQTANEHADNTLRPAKGTAGTVSGLSLIQISYIASIFGLSLFVNVFVWYRVSGGMFNPAVAFGLWLVGAFDWIRLVCVIPVQFLGGITAAGIVSGIMPNKLQAENSLGPGVSTGQGVVTESILTSMLMLTILMTAVEKSRVSFFAPAVIGIAVLIIHLAGINISGASVNPARTLGPALINQHYVPEIWIYFVGPIIGATLMAGVHALLKAMAYQNANPGQDGDGMEYYRLVPPTNAPNDISYGVKNSSSFAVPPSARFTSHRSRSNVKDDDDRLLLQDLSPYKPRKFYYEWNCALGSDRYSRYD